MQSGREDQPKDPSESRGEQGTSLEWRSPVRGSHPGDRFVRIARHSGFRTVGPGIVAPRRGVGEPKSGVGRFAFRLKRFVFGNPIASAEEGSEQVNKVKGLAVFASDNISSSAYATEEIMRTLVFAGVAALSLTMPLTLAIMVLIVIVVISYLQVIRAYPNGGGSYVVALDNLGPLAGLTAAAALLTDYILTVAVSVSAGVNALTSLWPVLFDIRVDIAVVLIIVMVLLNLRGLQESGTVFAIPTYIYVFLVMGVIGYGVYRMVTGNVPEYLPPPGALEHHELEALSLLLILRAFASGSVALTGTEAVSNGVPAFKPPEVRNAQITLVVMGSLFATIFFGISLLSGWLHLLPDHSEVETILSQLTRTLVGQGPLWATVQVFTALILVLAANTAFNGFPRLAGILAHDHYLPRLFAFRGERLAHTSGIILLAIIAGGLIVAYNASVAGLIPLYTVGVFLAFTLSQGGLALRWWRSRGEQSGWVWRFAVNAAGTLVTGVVMVVVAVTKFLLGAWMVLVLIPVLIWIMWLIHRHYTRLQNAWQPETPLDPADIRVRAIVPIANLGIPAQQALAYARATAGDRLTAVHVTDEAENAHELQEEWKETIGNLPLVIIESPYRSLSGPLMAYIDSIKQRYPQDTLVVVLPDFIPSHWWEHLLHNQTALRLKAALLFHPGIVVTSVPYHLPDK